MTTRTGAIQATSPAGQAVGAWAGGAAGLLWFAGTLLVSATLLFSVQPMVGKMLLPVFGGTPAVWNTCMLFFQGILLLGYGYAHLTTAWLGVRRQAAVHLVVVLLPLLVLPMAIAPSVRAGTATAPALWLLGTLLVNVGLPFFAVSTSAPLLQKWFASTEHAAARDPYFLYAASNAGSLLALLSYPLLIEPAWSIAEQSQLWLAGYAALVLLVSACAFRLWRVPAAAVAGSSAAAGRAERDAEVASRLALATVRAAEDAAVHWRRRAWWVLLAFVPSSLMLGVTTHITTNLATVPLLWIVPLTLYLLTFVLVFAQRRWYPRRLVDAALPYLLLPLAVLTFQELTRMGWLLAPLHLLTFFVAALVCHARLADDRPAATHLTEFYLWMSVGGVLGGVFNALVAPVVFPTVVEYPLVLVLACLALPTRGGGDGRAWRWDLGVPTALAAGSVALLGVLVALGLTGTSVARLLLFAVPAVICFAGKHRPVRFALCLAVLLAVNGYHEGLKRGQVLLCERNFFGVKRVVVDRSERYRALIHSGVVHGAQSLDPQQADEPLTYYHRAGPAGRIFRALGEQGALERVGVIGLGVGSLAAYAEPGSHLTFYEIDPAVVRLAEDPTLFTFLQRCRGSYDIVLGDGRLTLQTAPDHYYDAIVLDAFSADSIPTHLLTREAVQLYLAKLRPGGRLVLHISNRYLELKPLLAGLARDAGLVGLTCTDTNVSPAERDAGRCPAEYAVLARNWQDLAPLADKPGFRPLGEVAGRVLWTDQHSDLLHLLRWW